jgi:hypothetical protein
MGGLGSQCRKTIGHLFSRSFSLEVTIAHVSEDSVSYVTSPFLALKRSEIGKGLGLIRVCRKTCRRLSLPRNLWRDCTSAVVRLANDCHAAFN